jgi:hypothetical protein
MSAAMVKVGTGSDRSGKLRRGAGTLEVRPLPWPPPDLARRDAHAPHAHRCVACNAGFRCPGPDETGLCAPVCQPCYWVELGNQLRIYRSVVVALGKRRLEIERAIGTTACRRAELARRKRTRGRKLQAAMGKLGEQSNNQSGRDGGSEGFSLESAVIG